MLFIPIPGDPVTSTQFPNDQLTIIEYPYPCIDSISVTKQIACREPTNDCSAFQPSVGAYVGTNEPFFCYQITVSNSGTIPLTNLVVMDNKLGNLTSPYFATSPLSVLLPGVSVTEYFGMPWAVTTTNTVTVVADASLAHQVTNGTVVIHNGDAVSANSQAVAYVDAAAIVCSVSVSSPFDLNNPILSDSVLRCHPHPAILRCPPSPSESTSVIPAAPIYKM